MINVRSPAGKALITFRLGTAMAYPCDLNVLIVAGKEATGHASRQEQNKMLVARDTAGILSPFANVIIPCLADALNCKEPTIDDEEKEAGYHTDVVEESPENSAL